MNLRVKCGLLMIALLIQAPSGESRQQDTNIAQSLKKLSLDELGNIEVTSVSKEPEAVWKMPAAIYVLTQEDIRRSGATTIPELLRLAPGVEVARIKYEGSSPRHQILIQSFISLPKGFEFDQTYRHVSALPAQSVNAYGTADARLSRTFGESLELSLVGQNLLQPRHVEFGSPASSGTKRSVYAKVTWKR